MPKGSCNKAWVKPYIAIAKPTIFGALSAFAPAKSCACSASTGNTRNIPSIRKAYTPASDTAARHSWGNRAILGDFDDMGFP